MALSDRTSLFMDWVCFCAFCLIFSFYSLITAGAFLPHPPDASFWKEIQDVWQDHSLSGAGHHWPPLWRYCEINTCNTHGLTWFNTNTQWTHVCYVFQVLSSACCVETWRGKSAQSVSKILFSAKRDSKCSAKHVHLRCHLCHCVDKSHFVCL